VPSRTASTIMVPAYGMSAGLRRRQSRAQGTCLATHIYTIKVTCLANLNRPSATTLSRRLGSPILGRPGDTHRPQRGCQVPGHRGREPHKPPHDCTKQPSPMRAIATAARTLDYCKKPEHLLVQGPPRSLNTASSFLSWLPPRGATQAVSGAPPTFTSSLSELPQVLIKCLAPPQRFRTARRTGSSPCRKFHSRSTGTYRCRPAVRLLAQPALTPGRFPRSTQKLYSAGRRCLS